MVSSASVRWLSIWSHRFSSAQFVPFLDWESHTHTPYKQTHTRIHSLANIAEMPKSERRKSQTVAKIFPQKNCYSFFLFVLHPQTHTLFYMKHKTKYCNAYSAHIYFHGIGTECFPFRYYCITVATITTSAVCVSSSSITVRNSQTYSTTMHDRMSER